MKKKKKKLWKKIEIKYVIAGVNVIQIDNKKAYWFFLFIVLFSFFLLQAEYRTILTG